MDAQANDIHSSERYTLKWTIENQANDRNLANGTIGTPENNEYWNERWPLQQTIFTQLRCPSIFELEATDENSAFSEETFLLKFEIHLKL